MEGVCIRVVVEGADVVRVVEMGWDNEHDDERVEVEGNVHVDDKLCDGVEEGVLVCVMSGVVDVVSVRDLIRVKVRERVDDEVCEYEDIIDGETVVVSERDFVERNGDMEIVKVDVGVSETLCVLV
jgi:hypothetical protein